jgi:Kef-type K+ transport system membrane component KefB/mannitol/fructose-specific phosphotransferase system IIA component
MDARLTAQDVLTMLLAIVTLLTSARLLGELARRFRQPAVLGEILAGILLGPTVFGSIAPDTFVTLFPREGPVPVVLNGMGTIAIVLFMLVAGIEVDLSTVWRQGRAAIAVGFAGVGLSFVLGMGAGYAAPQFFGLESGASPLVFSLFLAAALSISALSVITRTLLDLYLYRSDVGMVIVSAAILDDLMGWMIFAVVLGLMGSESHGFGIGPTITITVAFVAFMLTLGRALVHRLLPWLQAYLSWPGGVLTFAVCLAILGASFTEWIGIHAVFGSFIVGVAIGDSRHLRERTRGVLSEFVSFIFAPLFFAGIGLKVNFVESFDVALVLVVLALAFGGKLVGGFFGARLGGMEKREALAIGFGMSARGSQEIILGLLALQYGLIREPLFVALVVMALVTSTLSGPLMQRALRRKRPRRVADFLSARAFVPKLQARDSREAILELTHAIAGVANLPPKVVDDAVWWSEEVAPTGLAGGLAVPHARLEELKTPVVGVGLSHQGIDFDSLDGQPARLIFFILTPKNDDGAQVEILADISRSFQSADARDKAMRVENYTQFRALLQSLGSGAP